MKQISLRGFGFLGIILFVPLFIFTFAYPQLIETSGKAFVEWKLNLEAEKKIDSIQLPKTSSFEKLLGNTARQAREEADRKLVELKNKLKNDTPAILAKEITKMLNLNCECRKKWESNFRRSIELDITSLEKAKARLIDFSQVKYMQIVEKLTLDVRIFLGANAAIFIMLFALSFFKPKAIRHLFLPGVLMLVSTVICSYFYLFEQNWFYTILYNDYTGFAFLGYLLIVFAILSDIAFNKARITTEILNAMLDALGRVATFVPC